MLTAVAVGTVIVLALYALLDTIISLLFNGAMWIAEQIMNSSVTTFSADQGNMVYQIIDELLPFASSDNAILNVGSIIEGVSYGILVLVIFIGVFKSLSSPFTGQQADHPVNIFARVVVAVVAKHVIFGFSKSPFTWANGGLLGIFGRWFGLILNAITANTDKFTNIAIDTLTINPVAYFAVLVLLATLLTSVLGAAISYIERLISFGASVLVGPIAISLYAYRETEDVAKQWIMSIFTQFGAIMLNLLLWAAFINQVNSLDIETGIDFTVGSGATTLLIFRLAVAIALLSVARNSEKILNTFGLRTMPNGDAARAIGGGLATLGAAAMMATRLAPGAKAAVERGMHGTSPAMGGKGGGIASTGNLGGMNKMPFTGNSNLFGKDGKMGVGGLENALHRGVARSGGNYGSAVAGAGSTRSAQNRQAQSISNLHSGAEKARANGQIAGAKLSSGSVGDNSSGTVRTQTYTGAQQANMAMNGHAGGNGFRFVGDKNGDMTYGTGTAMNGNAVTGVAGDAVFSNGGNGRESSMGKYFMPTENGGAANQLAVGSQIDLGDGKQWFVTGDGIAIDDSGALAYELREPERNAKDVVTTTRQEQTTYDADGNATTTRTYTVTATATASEDQGSIPADVREPNLFSDPFAGQAESQSNAYNGIQSPMLDFDDNAEEVARTNTFGENNIADNDQFDPEDN